MDSMVCILTRSGADASFERAKSEHGGTRSEGQPDAVYSYDGELMRTELKKARSHVVHSKAPGILGHVVKPGSISFYSMNGKTFAVSEGRWWLMKVCFTVVCTARCLPNPGSKLPCVRL